MDCIEIDPESHIPKKELYSQFCEYCRQNKLPTVSENTFHKKLVRQVKVEDYRPKVAGKRITAWRGIRWKNEDEESEGEGEPQEEIHDLTECIEDETPQEAPDQETLIKAIKEAVDPSIEKYKREQEPEGYPRTQIETNILSEVLKRFPNENTEKIRFYIKMLKERGEITL